MMDSMNMSYEDFLSIVTPVKAGGSHIKAFNPEFSAIQTPDTLNGLFHCLDSAQQTHTASLGLKSLFRTLRTKTKAPAPDEPPGDDDDPRNLYNQFSQNSQGEKDLESLRITPLKEPHTDRGKREGKALRDITNKESHLKNRWLVL